MDEVGSNREILSLVEKRAMGSSGGGVGRMSTGREEIGTVADVCNGSLAGQV